MISLVKKTFPPIFEIDEAKFVLGTGTSEGERIITLYLGIFKEEKKRRLNLNSLVICFTIPEMIFEKEIITKAEIKNF